MSRLVQKVGLAEGAGLFEGAGLYKYGTFDPLSLNPYLLFDAETSMLGTLEAETLDLDPANPSSLDVITATRAGTATITDQDGNIATVQANTVRVDHVDGVPMILVEPSATNLLPYSEDFSNAAWSTFGAGTGVAPTVTPDFGTSPDGTLSASRVQFNKGSGTSIGDMSNIFDSAQTSSGATTSKSVYLKSNTTEAYEMVIYEVTDASGTNVKKITVTPDWQRFHVYGAIASMTTGISIGLREISVSGLSNTADVLVWGAQVETGSVATSYIPTSGSTVTRAKDDLEISGSDFTGFFNGSEGTFYVETTIAQPEKQYAILRGGGNSQLFIYTNADVAHHCYDGATVTTFGIVTANQLSRFALSYNSGNITASLNGSQNTGTHSGLLASSTKLEIGKGYNPDFNGHFKRLIYWPTESGRL